MKYEVLTSTLADGYSNTWTDDEGKKCLFNSREEAQAEIDQMLQDVKDAVQAGDMVEEYDPDDFVIVEEGQYYVKPELVTL